MNGIVLIDMNGNPIQAPSAPRTHVRKSMLSMLTLELMKKDGSSPKGEYIRVPTGIFSASSVGRQSFDNGKSSGMAPDHQVLLAGSISPGYRGNENHMPKQHMISLLPVISH